MKKVVNYLTNLLTGLEGEPGIAYSYILAKGGLYLRAKNENLSVTVNIADVEVRGLAPISENIELIHGKIPRYLLDLAVAKFMTKPDIEQYMAITWEGLAYWLREPKQEAGAGHLGHHALGVVALILQRAPGLSPDAVRNILQSTAKDLGPIGKDTEYGAGLVDETPIKQKSGDKTPRTYIRHDTEKLAELIIKKCLGGV